MNRASSFFIALVIAIAPCAVAADGSKALVSDRGDHPFVLIARLHALPNAVQEVLDFRREAADLWQY